MSEEKPDQVLLMKKEIESDEIQTRLLLTVLYNKMEDYEKAEENCLEILKIQPNHNSANKLYAALLIKLKQFEVWCFVYNMCLLFIKFIV